MQWTAFCLGFVELIGGDNVSWRSVLMCHLFTKLQFSVSSTITVQQQHPIIHVPLGGVVWCLGKCTDYPRNGWQITKIVLQLWDSPWFQILGHSQAKSKTKISLVPLVYQHWPMINSKLPHEWHKCVLHLLYQLVSCTSDVIHKDD